MVTREDVLAQAEQIQRPESAASWFKDSGGNLISLVELS